MPSRNDGFTERIPASTVGGRGPRRPFGMLVIVVTGILAGIVLDSWSHLWIRVALATFIVIGVLMTPIGGSYLRRLREAIGQRPRNAKEGDPDPVPLIDGELAALQASNRPELLLAIGAGGFAIILYLMMFRPF